MNPARIIFALSLLFMFKVTCKGNDSITVYFFLLDECRICQEMAPEIASIYKEYSKENIGFVGLFPNFSSKPKGIASFKLKYNLQMETKTDYFKKMCHKFDVEILPTVVVFNETLQKIEYIGAINDLYYKPGKRKYQITKHYLRSVLQSIILGKLPAFTHTQAVGCYINFNDNLSNN